MEQTLILTGTQAAAEQPGYAGCRWSPLTHHAAVQDPGDPFRYVEKGELKAEFVRVESEHSAMGVCIAASIVGARAFTATAANGLAYMHEQLHWAAGARLPIVMPVTNRGVGAPWTILNDTQDTISQRDTGWMQFYCMNNQEVLDLTVVAFKAAEQLLVPCMVCFRRLPSFPYPDAGHHSRSRKRWILSFPPMFLSISSIRKNPVNINPVVMSDPLPDPDGVLSPSYMGFRLGCSRPRRGFAGDKGGGTRIRRVFGRSYVIRYTGIGAEDADFLFITMGALASEASRGSRYLREEGIKAGVLGVRVYRPFPAVRLWSKRCGAGRRCRSWKKRSATDTKVLS